MEEAQKDKTFLMTKLLEMRKLMNKSMAVCKQSFIFIHHLIQLQTASHKLSNEYHGTQHTSEKTSLNQPSEPRLNNHDDTSTKVKIYRYQHGVLTHYETSINVGEEAVVGNPATVYSG